MDNRAISSVRVPKAYLQIVETVIEFISQGKLEYGNRLYNEQELMAILDVSRPTLREALRVLEFLGITTVRPRLGITINQPTDSAGYLPLICILMFEKTSELELFELRRAIQVEMAGVAATSRTKEDLEELYKIVKLTRENINSGHDEFSKLDYEFHMQIMYCAHNQFAIKLMNTVGALMRDQLRDIIRNMPIELRQNTLRYHAQIADFIALEDDQTARLVMQQHLRRSRSTMTDKPISIHLSNFLPLK